MVEFNHDGTFAIDVERSKGKWRILENGRLEMDTQGEATTTESIILSPDGKELTLTDDAGNTTTHTRLTAEQFTRAKQRAQELANREACARNMVGIMKALLMYAITHGDDFPAALNVLVRDGNVTQESLACPSSGEPYVYVYPNKGANTPSKAIILYEPLHNHQEGIMAAYGDGHVSFSSSDEARKALIAQGLKVVE